MNAETILQIVRNATGVSHTIDSLEAYDLGGVDCPECGNTGYLIERGPGLLDFHTRECPCMNVRRSMRTIRNSGMSDMLTRYTLDSFETPDKERLEIKKTAIRFIEANEGWFFIGGRSGIGKTHICTAICNELIKQGKRTLYMKAPS